MEQKEGCSCNLYNVKNKEFQFIWYKLYLREPQMSHLHEESWQKWIVIEQV